MPCDLRSDNVLGCSPEILDAVVHTNSGTMTSYGSDEVTDRVRERCREIFETDLEVFPVLTGTAANALGIAALTPPWGAVFCHEDAHIHRDECGAAEFFSGGAKLILIRGANGKMEPAELRARIDEVATSVRTAVPACVSITNTTDAGTVYTRNELEALRDASRGLRIHMDGARFANAVAATGASPADMSWRAGVDILSFGATKNGAIGAELIVAFRKDVAEELALRLHRSGHRPSKMRFISAQLEAYLSGDLWLRNARHANAMAARLANGLRGAGIEIVRPVDANIVFAKFGPDAVRRLNEQGFLFYDWTIFGADVYRLVCGFATRAEDIDAFISAMARPAIRRA